MPSLRFRRVEQAQRGYVVSEKLPGGLTPSHSSLSLSSGSFSHRDSRHSSSSSRGSVVAFCAGHNALVRGQDGTLHPGRLLSASGSRIIDASASVLAAPTSVNTSREVFMPQWKVNLQARERYSKPLPQRYADGALRTRLPMPDRHFHVGKDSLDRRPSGSSPSVIR